MFSYVFLCFLGWSWIIHQRPGADGLMGPGMPCSTFQSLIWNTKKVALIYEFQHWDTELFPDSDDVRPAAWIYCVHPIVPAGPPRFVEDDRPNYADEFSEVMQFRTMPIYIIGIRTEWGLIKQYTFCSGVGLAEWTRVLISPAKARSWFHRKPRSSHWAVSFAKPGEGERFSASPWRISAWGFSRSFRRGNRLPLKIWRLGTSPSESKLDWTLWCCDTVSMENGTTALDRCPLSAVKCCSLHTQTESRVLGVVCWKILRNLCLDQYPTQWPQEERSAKHPVVKSHGCTPQSEAGKKSLSSTCFPIFAGQKSHFRREIPRLLPVKSRVQHRWWCFLRQDAAEEHRDDEIQSLGDPQMSGFFGASDVDLMDIIHS